MPPGSVKDLKREYYKQNFFWDYIFWWYFCHLLRVKVHEYWFKRLDCWFPIIGPVANLFLRKICLFDSELYKVDFYPWDNVYRIVACWVYHTCFHFHKLLNFSKIIFFRYTCHSFWKKQNCLCVWDNVFEEGKPFKLLEVFYLEWNFSWHNVIIMNNSHMRFLNNDMSFNR